MLLNREVERAFTVPGMCPPRGHSRHERGAAIERTGCVREYPGKASRLQVGHFHIHPAAFPDESMAAVAQLREDDLASVVLLGSTVERPALALVERSRPDVAVEHP